MKVTKIVTYLIFVIVVFTVNTYSVSFAHPGRTDANGGHTCRTNCEYYGLEYGEYHYHNGGGSGGSGNNSLNDYQLGAADGRVFAYGDSRPNIESSAMVEGNNEGTLDGSKGKTSNPTNDDSIQHCSPERRFTNEPSQSYKSGFMSTFTPACIEVYKTKFDATYKIANQIAKDEYEKRKAETDAEAVALQKTKDFENKQNLIRYGGMGGILAFLIFSYMKWGKNT